MDIKNFDFLTLCATRAADLAEAIGKATVKSRQTTQNANDLKILTGLIVSEVKKLPDMK